MDRDSIGLPRLLVTGTTRRRALQGATVGALAGMLASFGIEEVTAACVKLGQKGCKGPQNKKCCPGAACTGGSKRQVGRCLCKPGLTRCGAKCVNTKTNPSTAAAAPKPAARRRATRGSARARQASAVRHDCVDTQSDPRHCGACDAGCGEEGTCEQGICRWPGGGTCARGFDICTPHPFNVSCNQRDGQGECKCSKRLNGDPFCGIGMRCECLSDADCVDGAACVHCEGLCKGFGETGCASPCPMEP
jgi:hypothetical protein